jgi:Acetyl-CoA hydrolase/transferase N-terminal domain
MATPTTLQPALQIDAETPPRLWTLTGPPITQRTSGLTFSNALGAGHPEVTVTALGGASTGRRFFASGAGNAIPANISDLPGLIATGRLAIDVVLLQVSGPDKNGRYNAGLGIEHLHAAFARARLVVAQLNPELPWTEGDTTVEVEAIDLLVPAAEPPLELPTRPPSPIDRATAEHVSRLIPDRHHLRDQRLRCGAGAEGLRGGCCIEVTEARRSFVIARRPSGAEDSSGSAAPGAGTSRDILQLDNLLTLCLF